jgi:hypothetical protein
MRLSTEKGRPVPLKGKSDQERNDSRPKKQPKHAMSKPTVNIVKKKLTCRQDKPRGRRPLETKSKLADKPNRSKPKVSVASKKTSKVLVSCAGCGELEEESTEPWIGCRGCKTWYEVSCAGMLGNHSTSKIPLCAKTVSAKHY